MTDLLVVDDAQSTAARVISRMIPNPHWRAHYVTSGIQALAELCSHRFDLILADVHLSEMNGLELLREVQRREIGVPVVIMTSHQSEELVLECIRSGAANYVVKRHLDRDLPKIMERMAWLNGVDCGGHLSPGQNERQLFTV